MLQKIWSLFLLIAMIFVFTACPHKKKKKEDTNSTVIDNSKIKIISESTQYIQNGEKYVMTVEVEGCTDNLTFKLTKDDWRDFDIDPSKGVITLKDVANITVKQEYLFTVIAEACLDEVAELDITLNVRAKNEPISKKFTIAKTNGLESLSIKFNDYTVMVMTNKLLEDVSSDTIAIYGKVKGESTKALLKLNSNYPKGSKFIVKVYKGSKLISKSKELILDGDVIKFDDIK